MYPGSPTCLRTSWMSTESSFHEKERVKLVGLCKNTTWRTTAKRGTPPKCRWSWESSPSPTGWKFLKSWKGWKPSAYISKCEKLLANQSRHLNQSGHKSFFIHFHQLYCCWLLFHAIFTCTEMFCLFFYLAFRLYNSVQCKMFTTLTMLCMFEFGLCLDFFVWPEILAGN